MKGFLTFTLAAGVAITTTSVVQAAGIAKGAATIAKAPATAQASIGTGATGLTFFDDDVIEFFLPHAKGKSAIFLLAIGKPLKRKPQ